MFLCEILEKCETSLGGIVFEGIQDSAPALEALMQGCTLDEALLKTLEGRSILSFILYMYNQHINQMESQEYGYIQYASGTGYST